MKLSDYIAGSIQRKLTFVMLATAVVALLVTVAAMGLYDVRRYHAELADDLTAQADILGTLSQPALAFDDPKAAAENLAALRLRPQVTMAAIYDANDRLFAAYPPGTETVPPARPEVPGSRVIGDRMVVFHRIVDQGSQIGTVYISGRYALLERLTGYLMIVGLSIAASLVVALALSTWLRDAITAPVLAVAAAAQQVMQRRDYSLRVRKTTHDEVGVLVDAFNEMLSEAGRRSAELETANQELVHEMQVRQAAEDALRSADQRKDEFLATLAHELRNPLAPIRNALQLVRTTEDPALIERAQAIMERQVKQMVRLVDDLLDVSRITTGKLVLRRDRIALQEVIAAAVESVRPLVEQKRHQLRVDLPAEPIDLDGDPARLSQVFANVLNNAAKYTDEGGSIAISVQLNVDQVTVTIADNGIGIAADKLGDVFEMFAQVDDALERAQGGLGVGLALARKLVEMHGGTIEASSDGHGTGSVFKVRLPVLERRRKTEDAAAATAVSEGPPKRVLLVDDNRDFVGSLAALIEMHGHQVRTAYDGREALRVADDFRPEIAFLDLGLPLINGYELARQLRAKETTAQATLVAVSGWGQDKDRERARDAGFNLHFVKPVDISLILQTVHTPVAVSDRPAGVAPQA